MLELNLLYQFVGESGDERVFFTKQECGCKVSGVGTLTSPFSIVLCDTHSQVAPARVIPPRYTISGYSDIDVARAVYALAGGRSDQKIPLIKAARLMNVAPDENGMTGLKGAKDWVERMFNSRGEPKN